MSTLIIELEDNPSLIIEVMDVAGDSKDPNTERGFLKAEDKLVINMAGEVDRQRIAAQNKISDAIKTFNVNQSHARLANEVDKAILQYGKAITRKLPDVLDKASLEIGGKILGDAPYAKETLDKITQINRNSDKFFQEYYSGPALDRSRKTITRIIENTPSEQWGSNIQAAITRLIENDLTEQYFRITAINVLNRTRSYANLVNFQAQGVKRARIIAVLDLVTTKFCRSIDGRTISVDKGIKTIERMGNAETVEELDKINPWHEGTHEAPENDDLDIGPPPYHAHCRTRLEMIQES